MFRTDNPRTDAAAYAPADAAALLDEDFFDPAGDDALDRWLFEQRQSLSDFRNL
jgi:hypothetical protein